MNSCFGFIRDNMWCRISYIFYFVNIGHQVEIVDDPQNVRLAKRIMLFQTSTTHTYF